MSSTELFDRPDTGERALLVHMNLDPRFEASADSDHHEFEELAKSAGVAVLGIVTGSRTAPNSKFFIGSGKVDEIRALVEAEDANLVLLNHDISPSQERNLEKSLACRVYGRTTLILDIFAQRARTFEGKLQVELAQLKYMSSRLVRGWTHLERQKGGIGLRGPGETQLETDRRLLGLRIKQLQKRLVKVSQRRALGRKSRRKSEVPAVALVGYTNAGKSTLFNQLTGSDVYVENQLFATLDPTLRKIQISGVGQLVLADTVGFVRDLPHDLVAAFKSTLLETKEADLLLHVVDLNDENKEDTINQVNTVLEQIGADQTPQIVVFNKIDLSDKQPTVVCDEQGNIRFVYVSAMKGFGLEVLEDALRTFFQQDMACGWIDLSPEEGACRARLYEYGQVLAEDTDEQGNIALHVNIKRIYLKRIGISESRLIINPGIKELNDPLEAVAQAQ